jgi:hypothetical protein
MTALLSVRLRSLVPATFAAFGLLTTPVYPREAPIKVLLAAPIADEALGAIPSPAWAKYVAGSLSGYQVLSYSGSGEPTVEDCLHAGAEYLVVATFERRPQLPGLGTGIGRTAARAHRTALDCVSGDAAADDIVNFESDPAPSSDGDREGAADAIWEREVSAAFAKHPLALPHSARVILVQPTLARVSFRGALLHEGDVVKDVANAKNAKRSVPIALSVTLTHADYVEVTFDASGPRPQAGDIVER